MSVDVQYVLQYVLLLTFSPHGLTVPCTCCSPDHDYRHFVFVPTMDGKSMVYSKTCGDSEMLVSIPISISWSDFISKQLHETS